jgi:hypothetical protein
MSQIRKGTTYATGDQVSALNLNQHVDNAILLSGAINDQVAGAVQESDNVLLAGSSSLKRATVTELHDALVRKNGSVAMTGELQLVNSSPSSALKAASKGYVDSRTPFTPVQQGGGSGQGNSKIYIGWIGTGIGIQVDTTNFGLTWPINVTGQSTSCSGNAATANFATNANFAQSSNVSASCTGRSATAGNADYATFASSAGTANSAPNSVNITGDTMTGLLVLSGDPNQALGAATKQYVDNSVVNYRTTKIEFDGQFGSTNQLGSGTYYTDSTTQATFTFQSDPGLLPDHRFRAVCTKTSGSSAPGIAIIFSVASTSDGGKRVVATPHTTITAGSTGTFIVRKCLILSNTGLYPIANIVYGGDTANDGTYIVNLSYSINRNNTVRLFGNSGCPGDNYVTTGIPTGVIGVFDFTTGIGIPMYERSFALSTFDNAGALKDCGKRCSIMFAGY